jgi:hypothetical protein
MAAGCLDGVDGSGEDPLLEGRVADAECGGGFAGLEENVCGGHRGPRQRSIRVKKAWGVMWE